MYRGGGGKRPYAKFCIQHTHFYPLLLFNEFGFYIFYLGRQIFLNVSSECVRTLNVDSIPGNYKFGSNSKIKDLKEKRCEFLNKFSLGAKINCFFTFIVLIISRI